MFIELLVTTVYIKKIELFDSLPLLVLLKKDQKKERSEKNLKGSVLRCIAENFSYIFELVVILLAATSCF